MSALWLASLPALLMWAGLLLLPWQPWRYRERFAADPEAAESDLGDVTVLIPARDEAATIAITLTALRQQGHNLRVVLVDDQSSDDTAAAARAVGLGHCQIIAGQEMPAGWTGKLWALEQGRALVQTRLLLLLDADIALAPGTIAGLRAKLDGEGRELVSLMARLRMASFWEKLLLPAFIYFFKLLYPFALSNAGSRRVAAAAGGCMLLDRAMLARIGGFAPLRAALIDDCCLARRFRSYSGSTWVGVTHAARSLRGYDSLASVRTMVSRAAYTQLHYSSLLLAACTMIMLAAFAAPVAGLLAPGAGRIVPILALIAMLASYLPTLRYYQLSPAWALLLPIIGLLYLAMTWESAWRYWRGVRSQWRGRVYGRDSA